MLQSVLEKVQEERKFEQAIRKFGEVINGEPDLIDQLDQTADKDSFIALYVALAAERGHYFTPDELLVAVQEQKQGSNWVIPKSVLRLIVERF